MKRFYRCAGVLAGLATLFLLAETATAQRGFGRRFGGISKVQLAAASEVQAALNMTDEQKTKTAEINDKLRSDRRDLGFDRSPESRAEREQLRRDATAQVEALLDDAQRKRLQGIAIQVNGPGELADTHVATELNLSDEQLAQVQQAQQEMVDELRNARGDFRDLSRDERRAMFAEMRQQRDDKLLALLSDEQRTQFNALRGEPVEIDWSQFGRGRRNN